MTTKAYLQPLGMTAVAAALAAAFPAYGEEDEDIAMLTRPQSTVEAGVGAVSDDNLRFGRYSGLHEERAYLLLDADINLRDDPSGTWLRLRGRNLGLDSRELRFENERQGDWGYFVDFSQIPRFSPYIVNTTLSGIDTGTQVEGGVPARDVRLRTRRDALGLGVSKKLGGGWDASLRFRHEDKKGTRLFGHHSVRFLVDPIDYRTEQLEATVGFTGERLQLSGGYYGTNFQNDIPFVETPVGGGISPVALPPGNQSHQLFLSGGYGFTPTTRGMFKVALGRITQEEKFFTTPGMPVATGIPDNLGGRIDTTLVQAGLSARPMQRLSLRADLRHEERDDKTPVFVYTNPGTTHNGENEPRSFKTTVGKLDASYALPASLKLTGGVEYDQRKRNTSAVRSVSHRFETEELSYKLGLRRSLSETLNGALAYVHAKRDGSDWLINLTTAPVTGSNLIHPLHLADRDRDKVRLTLDWAPLDPLSFNFMAELSKDEYSGRTLGPREGSARFVSLDAAYRLSDIWQASAWVSRMDTRAEQATCVGVTATFACTNTAPNNPIWEARLRNVGDAFGIGLRGKPTGVLEVGAELTYSDDRGEFEQREISPGGSTIPVIPDANYEKLTLSLNGSYALTKRSGVRLAYVFDRFKTDDWYWTDFVYADGTTVRQDPKQEVHFVGASYYYRF